MKKLLDYGNTFIKECDWRDLALIKICLCTVGILWGLAIPKKAHKPAVFMAITVFVITYIPIVLKMLCIMDEHPCNDFSNDPNK